MRAMYLLLGGGMVISNVAFAISGIPFQLEQVIHLHEDHAPYDLSVQAEEVEVDGDVNTAYYIKVEEAGKVAYKLDAFALEDEGDDAWQVQEINILTPNYQDAALIHVGSTVRDFYAAYPQAHAYYDAILDQILLTRDEAQFYSDPPVEQVYYVVPIRSYKGEVNIDPDFVPLAVDVDQFTADAAITSIYVTIR